MDDLMEKVIRGLEWILQDDKFGFGENWDSGEPQCDEEKAGKIIWDALALLKAQEADENKYEYHTDHTNCPWYISGEESRCPVTCSQYRDGWNDAMNYIFRNGDGYRPYERIRKGR